MYLIKPKFWEKKNSILSLILLPLSMLFIFFVYFKKKLTKIVNYEIPVICVGNLYLGGTGKTPLSILIGEELTKKGINPAIVRKFYKNHNDEHQMLTKYFQNNIFMRDRKSGIIEAIQRGFDTVILDDGLQDYRIKKNFNIICFNQKQLIGNGRVIPAGPLREDLSTVKDANVIVINGKKDHNFEKKIFYHNNNIDIFYSKYKFVNFQKFENKKLFAIAGIGNPENFFELILKHGLNLKKKRAFPDHYKFEKSEIDEILDEAKNSDYKIITTEKDYYRLDYDSKKKIEYAKIELEIENKDKFINKILSIYD